MVGTDAGGFLRFNVKNAQVRRPLLAMRRCAVAPASLVCLCACVHSDLTLTLRGCLCATGDTSFLQFEAKAAPVALKDQAYLEASDKYLDDEYNTSLEKKSNRPLHTWVARGACLRCGVHTSMDARFPMLLVSWCWWASSLKPPAVPLPLPPRVCSDKYCLAGQRFFCGCPRGGAGRRFHLCERLKNGTRVLEPL